MPGCWIYPGITKKEQHSPKKDKKPAFNMSTINIYLDVSKFTQNVVSFLGRTKESAKAYRQSYYLCEITGNKMNLEITRKEAKEYLGIEFED